MFKFKRTLKLVSILVLLGFTIWWLISYPSNNRDWQPDVAVLAYAKIDGDKITVHNIRNFDYYSETDYTPSYYSKQFDLKNLESVDLIASYWMGPKIAHTFLSFGFGNGQQLAISVETRKEKAETYSTFKGFFRFYELYYVVADERDVIRLRTNYRKDPVEQVYIYRLRSDQSSRQKIFLEYINKLNQLNTQPEFYNTLLMNCTTSIWLNAQVNQNPLPFSWKILVSGYVPEYLYQNDRIESYGLSFIELQKRSNINERAIAADKMPDFSLRIRE